MYSTSVYNYIPRYQVVLYSGQSNRRYQIVYAKNITLNKGVDNRIQFQFLNQEQKSVDITGKQITFRFIDSSGAEIQLQKTVESFLPLTGLANLTITQSDLFDINAQLGSYSLEITDGNLNLPAFVNSEAGARGVCQIVDSVLPKHLPSVTITIPSHGEVSNTGTTYYSSVLSLYGAKYLTLQTNLANYSGNINVLGSTEPDSDWYTIESLNFSTSNLTIGTTIEGFHPYIKLEFVSTGGNVDSILAR